LSIPLVYLILPETKDLGLEDIQKFFEPKKSLFRVGISKVHKEITKEGTSVSSERKQNKIICVLCPPTK
jgi:hypothetical protein